MYEKEYLMLPGPTPVPPRVLRAMSEPLVNHRGPSFKKLIEEVTEGIQYVYQTKNDVLTLPSSGTGGLEAAIVNFLSPGDKVLALSIGAFGERFATIARNYGCIVEQIDYEWGTAANPDDVRTRLSADTKGEYKAVLVTHNETSTGVANDLKAISEARGNHPALLLVDSVSGLGVMDAKTDDWQLDVVVTAAQKGFMIPPGVAFVSVSPRAWKAYESSKAPKFYWDLGTAKKYLEKGQTSWTPPIPQYTALKEALKIFRDKGMDYIFTKQLYLRDITRAGVKAMGLKLVAADEVASAAVTAVWAPEGIEGKLINKKMREEYNVVVAGGQKKMENKAFRIGHLGYVQHVDMLVVIAALEMCLLDLGYPVELGKGVKAAQEVIMSRKGIL
ncbi:pyridoxal-phosphate-dependent aminotransferase family protein [Heliophilum fasciatum]|uniref:Aspartate aminotransferase-like enzyme n=1 Tax=Heliophilum fasciatum TaxID=35700 RepID=A0A4R2RYP6_9FIRM|nr:alanine--glyoxylate aminotransferase family protein [Heliophilum fasciatum]MCW2277580.1 aspartate aminotransferase-like enzyme [Heliophilum fasciatum]TCP65131.1 aspartate aminotransferase-like enzyme [Heliophilum fasciatum]